MKFSDLNLINGVEREKKIKMYHTRNKIKELGELVDLLICLNIG